MNKDNLCNRGGWEKWQRRRKEKKSVKWVLLVKRIFKSDKGLKLPSDTDKNGGGVENNQIFVTFVFETKGGTLQDIIEK